MIYDVDFYIYDMYDFSNKNAHLQALGPHLKWILGSADVQTCLGCQQLSTKMDGKVGIETQEK